MNAGIASCIRSGMVVVWLASVYLEPISSSHSFITAEVGRLRRVTAIRDPVEVQPLCPLD